MRLTNQKLSEKLDKLGVKSESWHYWVFISNEWILQPVESVELAIQPTKKYPAYCLEDILDPTNAKMIWLGNGNWKIKILLFAALIIDGKDWRDALEESL